MDNTTVSKEVAHGDSRNDSKADRATSSQGDTESQLSLPRDVRGRASDHIPQVPPAPQLLRGPSLENARLLSAGLHFDSLDNSPAHSSALADFHGQHLSGHVPVQQQQQPGQVSIQDLLVQTTLAAGIGQPSIPMNLSMGHATAAAGPTSPDNNMLSMLSAPGSASGNTWSPQEQHQLLNFLSQPKFQQPPLPIQCSEPSAPHTLLQGSHQDNLQRLLVQQLMGLRPEVSQNLHSAFSAPGQGLLPEQQLQQQPTTEQQLMGGQQRLFDPQPAPLQAGGHEGEISTRNFPGKLYRMLQETEAQGMGDIVSFIVPGGNAFTVYKPRAFEEQIMPRFFSSNRIASFQRQLNIYGFQRVNDGPHRGAYFHPLFLKGQPELIKKIVRQRQGKTKHPSTDKNGSSGESKPKAKADAEKEVGRNRV